MKTSDFYYDLPQELIAQTPLQRRDGSRLMTLERNSGAIGHHYFYELPDFLRKGDCLVLNNSRVLPARLIGRPGNGRSGGNPAADGPGGQCLGVPGSAGQEIEGRRQGDLWQRSAGGPDTGGAAGRQPAGSFSVRGNLSGDFGAAGEDAGCLLI